MEIKIKAVRTTFGFLCRNELGAFIYCCNQCEDEFRTGAELETHIEKHNIEYKSEDKQIHCRSDFKNSNGLESRPAAACLLNADDETAKEKSLVEATVEKVQWINKDSRLFSDDNDDVDDKDNEISICAVELVSSENDQSNDSNENEKSAVKMRKRGYNYRNMADEFVCDICQRRFSHKHFLKKHMMVHIEDRTRCKVCGKCYVDVKRHMRTHTGERPYKCPMCPASFVHSSYVKIHMRRHTGDKPYVCSQCGLTFYSSGSLTAHTKKHNKVRPFKCEQCERTFTMPYLLKDHIYAQHTGERPYSCDVCGNTFSSKRNRKQHMLLHGEKRYNCKFCDMKFSQTAGRRGHERRVHAHLID